MLDNLDRKCYIVANGEMSERFKEPVLKTGDGSAHRGFESHSLRQVKTAEDIFLRLFCWYYQFFYHYCNYIVQNSPKEARLSPTLYSLSSKTEKNH